MATENADLVDFQFLMDYLNSIYKVKHKFAKESIDPLVEIMKEKLEQEDVINYFVNQMGGMDKAYQMSS